MIVLVTGASSGIGQAVALAFARRGARVGLLARSSEKIAAVASACGGAHAVPLPADVGDPAAVSTAVGQLEAAAGPPDILVNCAGVMHVHPLRDLSLTQIEEMMRTNYLGSVYSVKAVLPRMLARGAGSIVNVSSLAGKVAARGYGGYAPTKFALAAFTDVLRQEVSHKGIHVCGVYPGPVDTNLIRDRSGRKVVDDIPGLPLYTPEYVAERIVTAVSRHSRDLYLPGVRGRLAGIAYALFPRLADAVSNRLPILQNRVD